MTTQTEANQTTGSLRLVDVVTLEVALHGLIVLVGLAMRLAQLGRFPLLASEAGTALAAWRGAHGQLWRPALYSPLLYAADFLPSLISGGSDVQARLLTALAGAALVTLPWFARDLLGRRGALLAAAVLALSPTWLYASRTATGHIVAILAFCVALLAVARQDQSDKTVHKRVAWVALALSLAAGWSAYTLIIAALLGLGWLALRGRRERKEEDIPATWADPVRAWFKRDLLITFGVVLVLAATTLGVNPSGLGAMVSLAGHWFATLVPSAGSTPMTTLLGSLAAYEPLALALGLVGCGFAIKRRTKLDAALLWWTGTSLVFGVLLGHRDGLWLLDALLPLTILAARGFESLIETIDLRFETWDWAMLWGALCLFALAFLQLAAFIQNGQTDAAWLAGLGLGLVALSLAAYGFWMGRAAVTRVAVWFVVILLAAYSLHTSVTLNYRTARQAHESLVGECVSADLARLPALVKNTSLRLVQDERAASVRYDASLDPLLGWYLRDMPDAEGVDHADEFSGADILITQERAPEWYPDGYAAERVAIANAWPSQELTLGQRLRWLIYRDDVGRSERTAIQLWVKLPTHMTSEP